jgi:hypothetical protein
LPVRLLEDSKVLIVAVALDLGDEDLEEKQP